MRGLRTHAGVLHSPSTVVRLLGAFVLIAAFVLIGAAPARAGENTFVEVTPNSVQAGSRVQIRASCDNANNRQAEVTSDAFNRVFLRPDNGLLTGSVTVPGNKPAGDYPVHLRCDNDQTASTTLSVLNMDQPTKGPATGGGGTASRSTGSMLLLGGAATVAAMVVFGLVSSRRRTGS
ncbi:hypothetical protein SAMN05443287_11813 [Micromonospora phaseoli]|uniref:Uncharacterized protein n=1 Tax=Micromonospora phaseoli TaxID=1144548 RepID=A0A1H7DWW2_9ACTN|nr:hypothetical protein [Micromonospora phaseoli]PZV89222.1 hypothetical protein CLV64_11643 [Micromonospora phaseoli]GIJ80531.1 hypothetical protein Xph01_49630 [Micromonospora phaseoli]SEK05317.1 hypothetical protein SAMN05443287_11813 [Micromonospora phaseoli]